MDSSANRVVTPLARASRRLGRGTPFLRLHAEVAYAGRRRPHRRIVLLSRALPRQIPGEDRCDRAFALVTRSTPGLVLRAAQMIRIVEPSADPGQRRYRELLL